MKERSANIDDDQDIVDFWNELVRNYEIEKDLSNTSGSPDAVPTGAISAYVYDQRMFCMAQPFSFSENCYPMCEIIKNCETHNNFLCPDDDIKPLMEKCCSLWDDEFECETNTTTTTSTPDAITISMMSVPISIVPSISFEITTESTEQNESSNHTSLHQETDNNVLVYILPVASILFVAVISSSVFSAFLNIFGKQNQNIKLRK